MHTVQGFAILTTTFYSSSLSTPSKKLFLRLMGYNKALDKGKKKHKKGLWSPDEDQRLRNYVLKHGHGCWTNVSINAGEYIPNGIWASREYKFHAIYFESQSLVWFDYAHNGFLLRYKRRKSCLINLYYFTNSRIIEISVLLAIGKVVGKDNSMKWTLKNEHCHNIYHVHYFD